MLEEKSLYQRLGGKGAIELVVKKFYELMLSDQRVSHHFSSTNMEIQEKRQVQFLTLVTGGPSDYEGKDMKAAHCKHAITQFDFDSTWQNLETALNFYDVPETQKTQLKEIFYSVQEDIVSQKQKPSECPFKNSQTESGSESPCKSLFEKLGGSEAIVQVVNKFYELMLQDDRVKHYFTNTDMKHQKERQVEFLAMVTGGPAEYSGKEMREAHCPYSIGMFQFDATWENLQQTLNSFSVPSELISEVKEIFYSVKEDIVNKNETDQSEGLGQIPITNELKQTTNLEEPLNKVTELKKCPFDSKTSSFTYQSSPKKCEGMRQMEKRKIKLRILEEIEKEKCTKKLGNTPYQKPYY